jgi:hypothetical protein
MMCWSMCSGRHQNAKLAEYWLKIPEISGRALQGKKTAKQTSELFLTSTFDRRCAVETASPTLAPDPQPFYLLQFDLTHKPNCLKEQTPHARCHRYPTINGHRSLSGKALDSVSGDWPFSEPILQVTPHKKTKHP